MTTQISVRIRKSGDRGHFNLGWLDTYHTFSFGDYHDPEYMGFRALRVINEDEIEPAQGFGTHPHRDMEILTYVYEGELEHKDSMGNGSIIRAGDFQRMTAGTGVRHSEFNPSKNTSTKLLQIWIVPERKDLEPGYEQKNADELTETLPGLKLAASREGGRALTIHQDVKIYQGRLSGSKELRYETVKGRGLWLQIISGKIKTDGVALAAGDGAAVENTESLRLTAEADSEFLLFDLV